MSKKSDSSKLPLGKFLAWKSSDVTAAGVNWIINTYLLFFCIKTLGIESAVAGTILLVSNIIDAVTDIIVGYIVDKSPKSKLGKYRPFELSIFGVIICVILMFFCPNGENTSLTVKAIWIFVFYTLTFGIFNTARVGSMTPYMIRAFDNDKGIIGKVSSYGGFVTTMGAAIITFTFPKLLQSFGFDTATNYLSSAGWQKVMLIIMIPLGIIAIFRFIFIKENENVDAGKQAIDFNIKEVGKMLKTNKYIWFYGIMIFAFQAISTLGVLPFYFEVFFGSQDQVGTLSLMSYFMLPLLLLMPIALKKFGATKLITYTAFIAIVGYVINFFAGNSMPLLIAGSILTSLVTLPISYLGNYIIMQIINYNEYKGIPRQDATTYSVASGIFSQLGQGFGPFITGLILQIIGLQYVEDEVTGAINVVTSSASAELTIRLLYSLLPLLLVVLVIIGTTVLNKLEKRSDEIEAQIAANK